MTKIFFKDSITKIKIGLCFKCYDLICAAIWYQHSTNKLAQINLKKSFLLLINFICYKGFYYFKRIREPEVRSFSKNEAFNVFKLESLNSKSLNEIHASLAGKVFYVLTAHFLLPWRGMVVSFFTQAIKIFVFTTINIALTIFYLFYCVGCIGRNI